MARFGIVVCTFKLSPTDLANKIHEAILSIDSPIQKLIRIYKGDNPSFVIA